MVIMQVVSQGAISAPMYSAKGPSMIQSLYPTAFPLKHQQKVSKNFCFQPSEKNKTNSVLWGQTGLEPKPNITWS